MQKRKIRPLVIGRDGAGKSALLATFPKPLWVYLFDPIDKAGVYLDRGQPGEIEADKYGYFQKVHSEKDGREIIRIFYHGEINPNEPKAFLRFIGRTASLEKDLLENKVATAGLDSTTHFELCTRFASENSVNKLNADGEITKDPRKHYGYSAHQIEQFVMTRWPNLIMCNSVVIGHPGDLERDETEDGEGATSVRTVEVPGKIAEKIGTSFNEVWRVYIDAKGARRVQTKARPGNPFRCKTSVGFVDGCYPHYDELWHSVLKEESEDGTVEKDKQA